MVTGIVMSRYKRKEGSTMAPPMPSISLMDIITEHDLHCPALGMLNISIGIRNHCRLYAGPISLYVGPKYCLKFPGHRDTRNEVIWDVIWVGSGRSGRFRDCISMGWPHIDRSSCLARRSEFRPRIGRSKRQRRFSGMLEAFQLA